MIGRPAGQTTAQILTMDSHAVLVSCLVGRLLDLRANYRQVEIDYGKLPVSTRRYLYGNVSSSKANVRSLAEAKILLAAILQWSPTSNGFSVDTFVKQQGPVIRDPAESFNELCPLFTCFFEDITKADYALSWYLQNFETTDTTLDAHYVDSLLVIAEAKLMWVQNLLRTVSTQGRYFPGEGRLALQDWMTFEGWNRFCLQLARGTDLQHAAHGLLQSDMSNTTEILPTELVGMDGHRIWFDLALAPGYEPWITFALSVFAEPEFDLRSATASDSWAFWYAFPNLRWKLSYQADPSLPDHHPDCADDSPCRRPYNACQCKARGQDCPNWDCVRDQAWWACEPRVKPQNMLPWALGVPIYPSERSCTGSFPYLDSAPEYEPEMTSAFVTESVTTPKSALSKTLISEYNARWDALTSESPYIPFPTSSFRLEQLLESSCTTNPSTDDRTIELRVMSFFLDGFGLQHTRVADSGKGAVLELRASTEDEGVLGALNVQLSKEKDRWHPNGLSHRSGQAGVINEALGSDFVVVAIRAAINELAEICATRLSDMFL